MIPSLKKRFWQEVTISRRDGAFVVEVDGHRIRTPAGSLLAVPTPDLADEIAAEWRSVKGEVDPSIMPMTRRANAAIDKVTVQRAEVALMLVEYGGSDLICYRANRPEALTERQALSWDPLIEWAASRFSAPLKTTTGLVHIAQNEASLARLAHPVLRLPPFALTGFHDLVTLSGSLVIGLALTHGFAPAEDLWQRSQVDEIWQTQLWGEDDEAQKATERKRRDFIDAFRFFKMVQQGSKQSYSHAG